MASDEPYHDDPTSGDRRVGLPIMGWIGTTPPQIGRWNQPQSGALT